MLKVTQTVLESEPDSMPLVTPSPAPVHVCAAQDWCAVSRSLHVPLRGPGALAQHGQLLMVGDEVSLVFHGSGLWSSPRLLLLPLLLPPLPVCLIP